MRRIIDHFAGLEHRHQGRIGGIVTPDAGICAGRCRVVGRPGKTAFVLYRRYRSGTVIYDVVHLGCTCIRSISCPVRCLEYKQGNKSSYECKYEISATHLCYKLREIRHFSRHFKYYAEKTSEPSRLYVKTLIM